MAVEICTDSSSIGMSPRISFSHDLNQSDIVPIEPHIPFKFDIDFDFCVNRKSYDQEPSLADELFANGIILPIQIKRKNIPTRSKSSLLPPLPPPSIANDDETEEKQSNNNNKKSFWKFKRSKSLNCGSICTSGFCSLPLLSRSKSTGSSSSVKKSLISRDEIHNHHHYYNNDGGLKQSNHKISSYSSHYQKPPLKKNYGSFFNSGIVQVSPVLNVPTGKLLGLGSIFSNGKDKNKKK